MPFTRNLVMLAAACCFAWALPSAGVAVESVPGQVLPAQDAAPNPVTRTNRSPNSLVLSGYGVRSTASAAGGVSQPSAPPLVAAMQSEPPAEQAQGQQDEPRDSRPVNSDVESDSKPPPAEIESPEASQSDRDAGVASQPEHGDASSEPEDDPKPKPGRRPSKILLPGAGAYNPPPATAPKRPTGGSGAAAQSANVDGSPPKPSTPRGAPKEGVIYWTGRLQQNRVIVIDAGGVNTGIIDGDLLPGVPVEVRLLSPAVAFVERPSPQNGWKRVTFRCLKTTKGTVTLNLQWLRTP